MRRSGKSRQASPECLSLRDGRDRLLRRPLSNVSANPALFPICKRSDKIELSSASHSETRRPANTNESVGAARDDADKNHRWRRPRTTQVSLCPPRWMFGELSPPRLRGMMPTVMPCPAPVHYCPALLLATTAKSSYLHPRTRERTHPPAIPKRAVKSLRYHHLTEAPDV